METAYAQALWNTVEKGIDPKKALAALYEKVIREGRGALLPRIARAFARIAQQSDNRTRTTVTIADPAHEALARREVTHTHGDAKDIRVVIDPTLIGGWRLESGEQLTDASYKKQLLNIYRTVTTAI
jgi:F0F1-type ATP synthase delta subunit